MGGPRSGRGHRGPDERRRPRQPRRPFGASVARHRRRRRRPPPPAAGRCGHRARRRDPLFCDRGTNMPAPCTSPATATATAPSTRRTLWRTFSGFPSAGRRLRRATPRRPHVARAPAGSGSYAATRGSTPLHAGRRRGSAHAWPVSEFTDVGVGYRCFVRPGRSLRPPVKTPQFLLEGQLPHDVVEFVRQEVIPTLRRGMPFIFDDGLHVRTLFATAPSCWYLRRPHRIASRSGAGHSGTPCLVGTNAAWHRGGSQPGTATSACAA